MSMDLKRLIMKMEMGKKEYEDKREMHLKTITHAIATGELSYVKLARAQGQFLTNAPKRILKEIKKRVVEEKILMIRPTDFDEKIVGYIEAQGYSAICERDLWEGMFGDYAGHLNMNITEL